MYSTFTDFYDEMESGKTLCVMPVPRLILEDVTKGLCGCNLYPANTLNIEELRIVSHPAWEWGEINRKGGSDDLEWSKSASTQISYKDYSQHALIAFTFDMDFKQLFKQSHDDLKVQLQQLSERAEQAMDLIRLDYCRMDLPETLPGRVGTLGHDNPYTTALFYTHHDHESYILGAEVITHQITSGLGLQFDGGLDYRTVSSGGAGNIARRGLTMMTEAMEANNLTSKFVQCISTLEFLAFPDGFEKMQKVKGQIAVHLAGDVKRYNKILEEFKGLTSKKNTAGEQIGLRTNIIHNGKRFEDLVPIKSQQNEIFRQLQGYIGAVVHNLIDMSDDDWDAVEKFREGPQKRIRDKIGAWLNS